MSDETFARLLRRYRERCGLSKAGLARSIGVSPGYVYLLEKGRTSPPTLERVEQLAACLKLEPDETDTFIIAAAAGRTGAAEARVLRHTGPQRFGPAEDAVAATMDVGGMSDGRIDLRDCLAVPVRTDAMAPLLCRGQLAICSRARRPEPGDVVMVTLQDGGARFGHLASRDGGGVTLLGSHRGEGRPPERIPAESAQQVLAVIGVLFSG